VSVSAVVVTHGPDPDLDRCVAALAPQVDELVVIANLPLETEVPARVLQNDRPLGFAANINHGVAATKGDFAVIANPDTEAAPGVVAILAEFASGDSRRGIVGPQLRYPDGRRQPSRRRFPTVTGTLVRRTPLRYVARPFERQRDHYLLEEQPDEPVPAACSGRALTHRRTTRPGSIALPEEISHESPPAGPRERHVTRARGDHRRCRPALAIA